MFLDGRRPRNAREIRASLVESLPDGSERIKPDRLRMVRELIQEGKLHLDGTGCGISNPRYVPNSKSVGMAELAEAFMGEGWASGQRALYESQGGSWDLLEAPAAVTSSLFPQITQQLLFSEIRAQFEVEANVFTPVVPVIPSKLKGTEIVPSITNVDPDEIRDVSEASAYPRLNVTEEYFTLPEKVKSGGIISLTREAIFFEQTGMLVEQARSIGQALGISREEELIDLLIGFVNNYSRNGTASNTYLTAGAYINNQSSLPLTDWNDIDTALQLFVDILDPNTSQPLAANMRPKHLVVMPHLRMKALQILRATTVHNETNSAADRTEGASPLNLDGQNLTLLSSQRLYRRVIDSGLETEAAKAQAGWFLGTLDEVFAWYECWPLALVQQGRESQASFDSDVDLSFKASYYGVAAVREPRKILRLEDSVWA